MTLAVCSKPVFVIGSPRSGTSILAWSLAQHPDMWTSSETDFLHHLFGRGHLDEAFVQAEERATGGWLKEQGISRPEFLEFLGLGINAVITSRSGGRRWVDQSPTYTLMVSSLAALFPDAFFLHIFRDGRKVVNSMLNSGFETPWAKDFPTACQTWARFAEVAMTFRDQNPSRGMTVLLDELAENPSERFDEILDFLQAERHEGPAEFLASHRINSSFDPRSQRGREGWRGEGAPTRSEGDPADPWSAWTDEQREIFVREAGEQLVRYGLADRSELS
ncbi:MAG: sulfotransferase family protein [Actinomycetota bacterium]